MRTEALVLLVCACSGAHHDRDDAGAPSSSCSAALDRTVATDFYDAVQCLFDAQGVAPGVIDRERVAVVHGRALDAGGAPYASVRVTVAGHPEFGSALTGASGEVDLAVNGGEMITLRFAPDDGLPVQRHALVERRTFEVLPDVVLVAESPTATLVDLAAPNAAIANGEPSSDASGTRQATVIVPPGTQATLRFPDGRTEAIGEMHVRLTEYTVGDRGPQRMPGDLPATSGYTYALELSVDEARAAGATHVDFSTPVIGYVDDFLGFPAGTVVPSGSFDRERDAWQPEANGRVVKVVAVDGGVAALDADGDGNADADAALVALGITPAERAALATRFTAGQLAWRVPLPHFSAYDFNWPIGPPLDAIAPDVGIAPNGPDTCRTEVAGSIIGCEDQSLGEVVPVVGAPFALHYQSERQRGRSDVDHLDVRLTPAQVPASLQRVDVEVQVLGKLTTASLPAAANLTYAYDWDGTDVFGRAWQGRQTAIVRVGYVYAGSYQKATQFGDAGSGVSITGDRARQEITLWKTYRAEVGTLDAQALGLGGWTASDHHVYDAAGGTLYLGDGRIRTAAQVGAVIATVAGTGDNGPSSGDGGPATQATLIEPHGIAVAPDGTVFFSEDGGARIRRVAPDGTISTYAGTGVTGFAGDGGLATAAQLARPMGLALDRDGTLYVADGDNHRVRAISPAGIITTIAGGGDSAAEDVPATSAQLVQPHAVALAPDRSLYIADSGAQRIRRVAPDRTIRTVAGGGTQSGGENVRATDVAIESPLGLAIGPGQELYFTEYDGNRIRRIDASGVIVTVAGLGTGPSDDGSLARTAAITRPHTVDLGPDGSLYFTEEGTRRVRRILPTGELDTLAGGGDTLDDNVPPRRAMFSVPRVVYRHVDGSIWIADFGLGQLRRVRPSLPSFTHGETALASDDGSLVYVFDDRGRHLRTVSALTGVALETFAYDAAGRLVSVTDRDQNTTAIERDADGAPLAIVGPFGDRTTLSLDGNGYLASITNPAGERTALTYGAGGLLATLTEPRGDMHALAYDAAGRLVKDVEPDGSFQTLVRSPAGVAVSTRLGRTRRFELDGATRRSTAPDGLQTTAVQTPDRVTTTTPTAVTTTELTGDPRFGMAAPVPAATTVRQGGLVLAAQETRTVELADPGNPLSVTRLVTSATTNNRTASTTWDAASHTLTRRTPAGRTTIDTYDAAGRLVESAPAGLVPTTYDHDAQGRVIRAATGDRVTAISYGANGRPAAITDALGRTTRITYDRAGRPIAEQLADGTTIATAFDANSNLAGVTTPLGDAHAFTHGPGDRLASYTPPGGVATTYAYDGDGALAETTLPGGAAIAVERDPTSGRITSAGPVAIAYDSTGQIASLARGAERIAVTYQGALAVQERTSGTVAATVARTYDANLWPASETVQGTRIAYLMDDDGMIVGAGELAASRDTRTGRVTATTLRAIHDRYDASTFGELASYRATGPQGELLAIDYTRDALGRITRETETIRGATHVFDYRYDARDRLQDVVRDGAVLAHHSYDANGNRTDATHDAQDRVIARGATSYTYTAAGALATTTTGGATTAYAYDPLGGLEHVTLPNGTRIDYAIDPQGRRIGKRVNGTLVQGFVYRSQIAIAAELDGHGNTVSTFVYGTRPNVPDYMIRGGAVYRILVDHLGSPRLVVAADTGAVVQQLEFDAWGSVLVDTNPGFQPFGFAGGLYDRDTGLVRFGARDYDPASGRWTARDPLGLDAGPNVYAYVADDPINRVDPLGLISWETEWWADLSVNGTWWQRPIAVVLGVASAMIPESIGFNLEGSAVLPVANGIPAGPIGGYNRQWFLSTPTAERGDYLYGGLCVGSPGANANGSLSLGWSFKPSDENAPSTWTQWFTGGSITVGWFTFGISADEWSSNIHWLNVTAGVVAKPGFGVNGFKTYYFQQ